MNENVYIIYFVGSCRMRVILGKDLSSSADTPQFHGEISRVNVFGKILSASVIADISSNCSSDTSTGDLVSWVGFDLGLGVQRIEPSNCGVNTCFPGYIGTHCDIKLGKS